MGKPLNHNSDEATQNTNTANELTSILDFDPVDGTKLIFSNFAGPGSQEGIPIFFDPRDGSDNPLPDDSELILQAVLPGDITPTRVSVRIDNLGAWNQLTLAEQRNQDNIDSVKVELEEDTVHIRAIDTLGVYLLSSSQIDWSNAELYIPPYAVQQVPWEA